MFAISENSAVKVANEIAAREGWTAKKSSAECACGESFSVSLFDEAGERVAEVIACAECYKNAANLERVESESEKRFINAAKTWTREAAEVKDWRVKSEKQKEMREIAREWTKGDGYKVASVAEMREEYGDIFKFEGEGEIHIWGIEMNVLNNKLEFVPMI